MVWESIVCTCISNCICAWRCPHLTSFHDGSSRNSRCLAATVLSVGVNAGPYKPYSSVALSSTIAVETTATTLETTSSIITADVTDTTDFLETTVTEPATGSTETTDALESTITESATDTAAGPGPCVETQILGNPSFDDNNDGSPWVFGAGVTVSQIDPRSAPNFL